MSYKLQTLLVRK